ncbi:MAG: hypothetical protein ACREIA_19535, partial [Opitutaceae bacterium]
MTLPLFVPRVAAPLIVFVALCQSGAAGEVEQRMPRYRGVTGIVRSEAQPEGLHYLAFPTALEVMPGELWIAYKAGASHASDAGAAIEIVRHRLETGETELIQRLRPDPPQLYQMAELARLPDETIALYIDVHGIGHDSRHYRTGAGQYRWDSGRGEFVGPTVFPRVDGVTYGYPFDFIVREETTWLLIMSFGYLPEGRWSVDVIRSDDSGGQWRFVRNLSEEFGGLRINESAFVPHGDGFVVTTRGYDNRERLHRVDREFRVEQQ